MTPKKMNTTVVWKSTLLSTTEHTTITTGKNIRVKGRIVGKRAEKLISIEYHLEIDTSWVIQSFSIDSRLGNPFSVSLHKNKKGEWVDEKETPMPEFADCTDIDIMLTPFTNTLPINRLNLSPGMSEEINVIYVDLKQNRCYPARQRYTNEGDGIYKYESLQSDFTARLMTDEHGLVLDYPGIWRRVNL